MASEILTENTLQKLKALKTKPIDTLSQKKEASPEEPEISYEDREKLKSRQIARACALNCAAEVTAAFARTLASTDMAKTFTVEQLNGLIKSIKATEYADNIKILSGDDSEEEIPF